MQQTGPEHPRDNTQWSSLRFTKECGCSAAACQQRHEAQELTAGGAGDVEGYQDKRRTRAMRPWSPLAGRVLTVSHVN